MTSPASVDRDRLLQTFLDLVAVDSPSGHEQAIGDLLETRFAELGCETTRDDIGNLVAVYPGRRDGTILLSTHMDTVGPDTGIKPIIGDDGVIRTDGSTILGADDKSGIAGCLELLTLLGAHPGVVVPDHRVRVLGGRGGRPGRFSSPGRREAERHPRVRVRHRGRDGVDHLLGADRSRRDGHLHRPQGARGSGAREGHRCDQGRRGGGGRHAAGPHRRGDRRQHRHVLGRRRAQRRRRPRRAPGHGPQPRPGEAGRPGRRDADRVRGGGGPARRGRRLRQRGDVPHLQDRGGRRALRRSGRGHPVAGPRGRARASPAAAPTATSSTPRASRASGCRRAWSTSTRTSEHIAIDDMVTACQIMVGIVTGPAPARP